MPDERATAETQPVQVPCGDFVAEGHETFDPDCPVCAECNSDAPDWDLS